MENLATWILLTTYSALESMLVWVLALWFYQMLYPNSIFGKVGLSYKQRLQVIFCMIVLSGSSVFEGGREFIKNLMISLMVLVIGFIIFQKIKEHFQVSFKTQVVCSFWSELLKGKRYIVFLLILGMERGLLGILISIILWIGIAYMFVEELEKINWRDKNFQEFATYILIMVALLKWTQGFSNMLFLIVIIIGAVIGAHKFQWDGKNK